MLFDTALVFYEFGKYIIDKLSPQDASTQTHNLSAESAQHVNQIVQDLLNHFSTRMKGHDIAPCRVVFRQSKAWQHVISMLDRHQSLPQSRDWKMRFYNAIASIKFWHERNEPLQIMDSLGQIRPLLGHYPQDCEKIVTYVQENWDGLCLLANFPNIPFDNEKEFVQVTTEKRKTLPFPAS